MGNSQGKEAPEGSPKPMEVLESPYVQHILEARQKLTGWERLKMIFVLDEYGGISPELMRIVHTMCFSMAVGGLIGAMGRGRIAHMNFMRSHAHEAFETPLQAKRKLQDSVTLGMGSGAFRIAWRVTLFTTVYMSVSTAVSTYRGKMGILDQVVGAGSAGFLYKLPQGPKAQVAGAVVGSLLGLSAGIMTMGITKLTGETIDTANLRYYQHLSKKEQEQAVKSKESKEFLHRIERPVVPTDMERYEHDSLTKFHDQLIAALEESRQDDDNSSSSSQKTGKIDSTQQQLALSKRNDKTILNNESSVHTEKTNSVESKTASDVLGSKSSSNKTQKTAATASG